MHTTTLFLPFPPSLNGLFAGKTRRYKSKKYISWLKEAQADLEFTKIMDGFKWKNHISEVDVILMLKAPDKRIRDADNCAKAVMDLLVANEVIKGDDSRYVRSLMIQWRDDVMTKAGVFIIITDIEKSKEL
jgi:crossover junction endodeoxyribonuclease RusA